MSYKSEEIYLDILLKPHTKQLLSKLNSFLLEPSSYHHLVYAGVFVKGSNKWLISDAAFPFSSFIGILKSAEVLAAIKEGFLKGTFAINCGSISSSNSLSKLHPAITFKINPSINSEIPESIKKKFYEHLSFTNLSESLQESNVVGSIRFHKPTIYIFPAGLGSSCLFGINGFSLLVDGGFNRKSCFWDFAKHLERIDTVLITHFGEDNLFGLSSAFQRKKDGVANPEIGYVFANCIKGSEKAQEKEKCEIDVGTEGGHMIELLKEIGTPPKRCIGSTLKGVIQPINLYHKLGHGSLDLYVLNPMQESASLKSFLNSWSKNTNPFTCKPGADPLSSLSSICAVVLWQPTQQAPTRLLFPGTVPQQVLLESLDRLSFLPIFESFGENFSVRKASTKNSITLTEPRPIGKKSDNFKQKPFYFDIAYIPSYGDHQKVDKQFFTKVRSRYYVLSNPNPSSVTLSNLLEAKETWTGNSMLIPTHDSDTLRFWVAAHQQQLSQNSLSISPSASRCSIQLEDYGTSCAAYRLEF